MGKVFEGIDPKLRIWIGKQPLFFVGTAPLGAEGHINVSPKGPIGSLCVVDANTVAYLDAVGSGAETIAHIRENGRICVMFCSFEGPPRILRLHGRGEIVLPHTKKFDDLIARCRFDEQGVPETRRAVIVVHVRRIADSCGYGVPLMAYEGSRPHMKDWATKKMSAGGRDAIDEYQRLKNAASIDGLPALELSSKGASDGAAKREKVATAKRASSTTPRSGKR